jgi:hypothetical protein
MSPARYQGARSAVDRFGLLARRERETSASAYLLVALSLARRLFMQLGFRGAARARVALSRVLARYLLLLSLLALPLLGARPVHADAGDVPAGYMQLIDEAVEEAAQAHFAEARALFAQAHALYPNARTLRGLGMMAYEQRSYVESISFYEQALASKVRPLDAALRADALATVERARRFVAEVTLSIAPPGTRVSVDDQRVTLPASNLVRLDPGSHTLRFEAAGYRPETRTLAVRGGEILSWEIALALATPPPASRVGPASGVIEPATAAAPGQGEQRDAPAKRLYRNPWLWTGVALAVSAVAVGVGLALKNDPKSVQDPPTTSQQSPPEGVLLTLVRRP